MRKLPVLVGMVAALAMSVALASWAQAQQERGSTDAGGKKPMTIQGVVAEITAEGEIVYDYAHNRAVAAEAAFLTVVGAPKDSGGGERAAATKGSDKSSHPSGQRDNIYIVWLTPKTKVCKALVSTGGVQRASTTASRTLEKKECSPDELEVGEPVEIAFVPREEINPNQVGHQTAKMRQTHGRNRTYIGDAVEVTIIQPANQGESTKKNRERPER